VALTEWGLTPEYLNETWTEELLHLMFVSRGRRFERARGPQVTTPSGFVQHDGESTREREFASACFSRYTTPVEVVKDLDVVSKLKELEKYQV
jgi:hypothetical protein